MRYNSTSITISRREDNWENASGYTMIKLHFAILWHGRMLIAASLFCMLLLCVAMSFAGWLDSPMGIQHAGWICLLIFIFAVTQTALYRAGRRSVIFIAQKQFDAYIRGELCAVVVLLSGFAALWNLIAAVVTGLWMACLMNFVVMGLFCAIASHAAIANLEPHTVALIPSQRHLLLLVMSGPWILPAWILGLLAGNGFMAQQPDLMPVLLLLVLGLVQYVIGALFRRNLADFKAHPDEPHQNQADFVQHS